MIRVSQISPRQIRVTSRTSAIRIFQMFVPLEVIISWTVVQDELIIYRKGIRGGVYVIDKSIDGGLTWELNLVQIMTDEDAIIMDIDAGVDGFRHVIRNGAYCIDEEITALGFAGVEDTDWVNIYNTGGVDNGYLYNWYAISNVRGLAPAGWHVPDDNEFETLRAFLGGLNIAGGPLKESGTNHWDAPNTDADNSSGFTGLGSGIRIYSSGVFNNLRISTSLWSTTTPHSGFIDEAGAMSLRYDNAQALIGTGPPYPTTGGNFNSGHSVRLIRDTDIGWVEGEWITDYDGNIYQTIRIGTQIWTVQNLAVTHYRDGTAIPNVTDNDEWVGLGIGAYCAYDNDESYVFI